MASRKKSVEPPAKTELVAVVAGPTLELPAGSINTQLTIDHVADVVYTALKRRLRADLDLKLEEARTLDEQLHEVRDRLTSELEGLRVATLELATESPEAVKARIAAEAHTAFSGKVCDVTIDVEVADEMTARKGIGCTAIVTLLIDKRNPSYGKHAAHDEPVRTTWPATEPITELIRQIDELLVLRATVAKLAHALRDERDRADLHGECKAFVIEQVMHRNEDTDAWLTALYGKLGLVIDSRAVREQLKLVAS